MEVQENALVDQEVGADHQYLFAYLSALRENTIVNQLWSNLNSDPANKAFEQGAPECVFLNDDWKRAVKTCRLLHGRVVQLGSWDDDRCTGTLLRCAHCLEHD